MADTRCISALAAAAVEAELGEEDGLFPDMEAVGLLNGEVSVVVWMDAMSSPVPNSSC